MFEAAERDPEPETENYIPGIKMEIKVIDK